MGTEVGLGFDRVIVETQQGMRERACLHCVIAVVDTPSTLSKVDNPYNF